MSENGKLPDTVEIEVDAPKDAAPKEVAGEANTSPVDAVASLNAEIEKLKQEKTDIYNRLLRTAADFENFKKRSKKEGDEAADRGRQQLLQELLPAIDDLERAVAHESSGGAVVEGIKLVLKKLTAALEKFNVRAFESVGKAFDPAVHEAIQQQETDEHPPGSVVTELQKGYMIGTRLLRPALVVVAKPRTAEQPGAPEGEAS